MPLSLVLMTLSGCGANSAAPTAAPVPQRTDQSMSATDAARLCRLAKEVGWKGGTIQECRTLAADGYTPCLSWTRESRYCLETELRGQSCVFSFKYDKATGTLIPRPFDDGRICALEGGYDHPFAALPADKRPSWFSATLSDVVRAPETWFGLTVTGVALAITAVYTLRSWRKTRALRRTENGDAAASGAEVAMRPRVPGAASVPRAGPSPGSGAAHSGNAPPPPASTVSSHSG